MFQIWLILHVLGAIIAFGFAFTAPVFGRMLAAEPQHANWFLRAVLRVSTVILIPAALSMAVTGLLLVGETGGLERFREPWLAIAVVIYIAAVITVLALQRPTLKRVIALTSGPPGPAGPSPEVPLLVSRLRLIGYGLMLAISAIVILMIGKPWR